jgi:5'-3' exonuclease
VRELALVDGDIVCYRCAATAENDPVEVAEVRVDELMRRILHETDALTYKAFLTGKDNFRKTLYPEYKANRKDKPRPIWLQACRDHLIKYWNAVVVDGREADDELGIEQTAHELDSIICSIDKDLLQIPGYHYNFVKSEQLFVSPYDGLRNFYAQVITGDASDYIPAFDGKFRTSIPKFVQKLLDPLWEMTEELDMYNHALQVWLDHSFRDGYDIVLDVQTYAKCLWIMRKEGEYWRVPEEKETDHINQD